ncbi:MAG: ABC transporter ATP-binding protein [Burkholderiales bacterium]|nr:ABC transporter ATP-binding protein [Burkholderiales bacterium]
MVHAVRGVSFAVGRGETLGLVGESGCGKSVTCLALLALLPGNGRVTGEVEFDGRPLTGLAAARMDRVLGRDIAMVFQDPVGSLNPVHTIGWQIAESLRLHRGMIRREAQAEALRLLERVGIPEARRRLTEYPHQLSGGMNQRAMIAMALACRPKLLIADEPTTALDVTIQAQIIELLKDLQSEFRMSVVLVTHDLGIVAEIADRVAVMYAGSLVEEAPVSALFRSPAHPYTAGLLASMPRIDRTAESLNPIEGAVPSLLDMPPGCAFEPRCPRADTACRAAPPPLLRLDAGRRAACVHPLAAP